MNTASAIRDTHYTRAGLPGQHGTSVDNLQRSDASPLGGHEHSLNKRVSITVYLRCYSLLNLAIKQI